MKNITLTPQKLSLLVKNCEIIGNGSYGIIYKLNDDTLLKFSYKDFLNDFKKANGQFNFHQLGDISQSIQRWKDIYIDTAESELLHKLLANNDRHSELGKLILKYLDGNERAPKDLFDELFKIEQHCKINNKQLFDEIKFDYPIGVKYALNAMRKQSIIKHTTLPQGIISVDDFCVGFILKNNKNMENLFTYLSSPEITTKTKEIIFNNIETAVRELISNGIFHNDLKLHNIMINRSTNEIQIIDTDDVTCLDELEENKEENKNWINIKKRESYSALNKIQDYICKDKSDDFKLSKQL